MTTGLLLRGWAGRGDCGECGECGDEVGDRALSCFGGGGLKRGIVVEYLLGRSEYKVDRLHRRMYDETSTPVNKSAGEIENVLLDQ